MSDKIKKPCENLITQIKKKSFSERCDQAIQIVEELIQEYEYSKKTGLHKTQEFTKRLKDKTISIYNSGA